MTQRITIGVDPGQTGAVAILADGEPIKVFDMPVSARKAGGQEVSAPALAIELRAVLQTYVGAHVFAVIEQVGAMPGQGVSSMFRFGDSYGVVRGVLAALGVGYRLVHPSRWKAHHGLSGSVKDVARTTTMTRWPAIATELQRKKDCGRADAILIAAWCHDTEQHAAEKTA